MKSKRAREAAPAPAAGGERAGEGVEEPPAKKHKSSGDGDEAKAKKAKKDKRDKRESRKERKERMKDLQNLPGEDGEAEGEEPVEVREKDEEKEKKEKKAKKEKKEKEKKEKKEKKGKKEEEEGKEEEEEEEDKETKDERKKDKKKKEKKERDGEVEGEKDMGEDKKDEEMGPAEEGKKEKKSKSKKDKKAKKAKEVNGDGEVKGEAKEERSKEERSKDKKDKKKTTVKEQAAEASDRPADDAGGSGRHIVFVGNLPFTATAATIEAHFAPLAPLSVRCLTQRDKPSACRGIAFVEFASAAAQRTCLDRFHHSLFDDGASPARRINVELTAGGGGRTELRRERIRDKNKKLDENRAKRIDKEKAAKLETDGSDDKQQRMGDSIHPSRLARNPRLGH